MTFRDELSSKVAAIREAAEAMYREDLIGFKIENGQVVEDELNDSDYQPAPQELVEYERERYRNFQESLDNLESRFETYYELNRASFTLMASTLGGKGTEVEAAGQTWAVYGMVGQANDGWMIPVLDLITEDQWSPAAGEGWGGTAAQVFHSDFLDPFREAATRQMACVRELAIVVESYRSAVDNAQEDLLKIADLCLGLLQADRGREPLSAAQWFGLVGIVAGAVGLVTATGGAAIVLEGVLLGADIVSFVAEAAGEEEQERAPLEIEGSTAEEIISSTWSAFSRFERLMVDVDDILRKGLERDLESSNSLGSAELELPRPALAEGAPTYEQLTVPGSAPGVPVANDPVVVSIVNLYRAGYVNLPNAADLYRQARDALANLSVPGEPPLLTALSRHPFERARDRLVNILTSIHDSLVDAGAAMVQSAEEYQLTDEQSAEAMRQIGRFLLPEGEIPVGLPA